PAPAEPPAAGGLMLGDGDGTFRVVRAEERLRRLGLCCVAIHPPEAAEKEWLDEFRRQRVAHQAEPSASKRLEWAPPPERPLVSDAVCRLQLPTCSSRSSAFARPSAPSPAAASHLTLTMSPATSVCRSMFVIDEELPGLITPLSLSVTLWETPRLPLTSSKQATVVVP